VFLDLDTLLLRDWTPVLSPSLSPWGVRSGVASGFDSAVLRLAQQPDELTSRMLIGTMRVRGQT
jgi:hypothetical protein